MRSSYYHQAGDGWVVLVCVEQGARRTHTAIARCKTEEDAKEISDGLNRLYAIRQIVRREERDDA